MSKKIAVLLPALCCALLALSQTPPQGITYQAVARSSIGNILNDSTLMVQIGIVANDPSGDLLWQEWHEPTTNAFGLFTLTIGEGISSGAGLIPSFDLIEWSAGEFFLSVEVDPGDGVYELLGISQFLSVPFALYAGEAGGIEGLDEIDGSNTNECIDAFQLDGSMLNITQCDQNLQVDLSELPSDDDWTASADGNAYYNLNQDFGISTETPSSTLHVNGSIAAGIAYVDQTGGAELDDLHSVYVFDVTTESISATLPAAATCPGRQYDIKLYNDGDLTTSLTLITSGSETIDGLDDPNYSSVFNSTFSIMSDGSTWWVIRGSVLPN